MNHKDMPSLIPRDLQDNATMWGIAGKLCKNPSIRELKFRYKVRLFDSESKLRNYLSYPEHQNLFAADTALSLAAKLFHEQAAVAPPPIESHFQTIALLSDEEVSEPGKEEKQFRLLVAVQTIAQTTLSLFEIRQSDLNKLLQQLSSSKLDQETIQPKYTFNHTAAPEMQKLWRLHLDALWVHQKKLQSFEPSRQNVVGILSGSFNPLHEGHQALRLLAQQHLEGEVCYEMPIKNADKPPLDYLSLEYRLQQFDQAPLLLTTAATFLEKAKILGATTFIVGADTAERILQERFYQGLATQRDQAIEELIDRKCRFLVAPRQIDNRLMTQARFEVPSRYKELFEFWSEEDFRKDISSSELRMRSNNWPPHFDQLH